MGKTELMVGGVQLHETAGRGRDRSDDDDADVGADAAPRAAVRG